MAPEPLNLQQWQGPGQVEPIGVGFRCNAGARWVTVSNPDASSYIDFTVSQIDINRVKATIIDATVKFALSCAGETVEALLLNLKAGFEYTLSISIRHTITSFS